MFLTVKKENRGVEGGMGELVVLFLSSFDYGQLRTLTDLIIITVDSTIHDLLYFSIYCLFIYRLHLFRNMKQVMALVH